MLGELRFGFLGVSPRRGVEEGGRFCVHSVCLGEFYASIGVSLIV
jgi:hypothetical protein